MLVSRVTLGVGQVSLQHLRDWLPGKTDAINHIVRINFSKLVQPGLGHAKLSELGRTF